MDNFNIVSYNSNSLRCNQLLGPRFSFRNMKILNDYARDSFICLQEVRLNTFSKDLIRKKYNSILSDHGDSRGGGLAILCPSEFKILKIIQDQIEGSYLGVALLLPDNIKF